jgi:hypothetical protein
LHGFSDTPQGVSLSVEKRKRKITRTPNRMRLSVEKHHEKCSSADEFRNILDDLGIEYDERYIF